MEILYYIILGLVQGLTEFLPVSSSGHLVLLNILWGKQDNFIFVSVLLHIATLLAVLLVFRKEVVQLILHPFSRQAKLIYTATIPTVIIVLLFKGVFESSFSGTFLPICFIITAVLLLVTSLFSKQRNVKEMSYKSALIMGISQGIAVFPGISRSGATICTGLLMGEDKKQTTKFSFLMSLPIIVCSMLYEVFGAVSSGAPIFEGNVFLLIVAFIVAFVSGVFAIKFMLKIVEKGKYWYFSIYLFILGVVMFFII